MKTFEQFIKETGSDTNMDLRKSKHYEVSVDHDESDMKPINRHLITYKKSKTPDEVKSQLRRIYRKNLLRVIPVGHM